MKPELIQFSLSVCERVLQKELRDPSSFKELFQHLVDKANPIIKSQPIHIHLPKETFSEHRDLLQREPSLQEHKLHFKEDSSLSAGSMRLETDLGLVNFDIPRLMKELEASALSDSSEDI